ncbi:MAG: alpha-glucan family phosphorylase [bacterium]
MVKALRYVQVDPNLPKDLKPLQELAWNLWWCWEPSAIELFRTIDNKLWERSGHSPLRVLGLASQTLLEALDADLTFKAMMERVYAEFKAYMGRDTWFARQHFEATKPEIAYFSAEFGLTESLPIYSGGLGVLAGDHLKSASDLGLPLIGVGLLYHQGYFQQYLNADGWQQEYYPVLDFSTLPVAEAKNAQGEPLIVAVELAGRSVQIKVWKVDVGRIALYLLDTNIAGNSNEDRQITAYLYGGDSDMRVAQEAVLGIGGIMALQGLNIAPSVFHMNEGHSAFLGLERVRQLMETEKLSFREAQTLARHTTVFTTHTPVPAGIDRFPRSLVEKHFKGYAGKLGLSMDDFMRLGYPNSKESPSEFNMAHLAISFSGYINGVSKLHGETSRKMWQSFWQGVPLPEVPITSVTNGVHTRSWISVEMRYLFDRYLGHRWAIDPADQSCWQAVSSIPDGELWRTHQIRRERMIGFVRSRLEQQLTRRGAVASDIERAGEVLNSDYLTIGFARRFAAYKRGTLIFRDLDRLKRLVNDEDHPVQFIIAGKAHPRDNYGKELIKTIIHLCRDPEIRERIVFLENYDISVARYLVQGVDVWLNNPRRPMEASGTSGMKVIFNGGLNASILDGWWCEGYSRDVGWAIGAGEEYDNHDYQDEVEANAMYDLLEKEIAPTFYDQGRDGIPRKWIALMKASMQQLGPRFNSNRMVKEYTDSSYINAYRQGQLLQHNDRAELRSLAEWHKHLTDKWTDVRVLEIKSSAPGRIGVNEKISVETRVFLGELQPDDVLVELYIGAVSPEGAVTDARSVPMEPQGSSSAGVMSYHCELQPQDSGRLGFSVRVSPGHRSQVHPFELGLVTWAGDDI